MCEVVISMSDGKEENRLRLVLRTLLHAFYVFVNYGVSTYGLYIGVTMSEEQLRVPLIREMQKFVVLFLTNWNYMFQTVFLSLSLLYDMLEWLEKHQSHLGKKLRYYRDVIFCGMVVPFTLFISLMFWTVYLIDRELVFPTVYDQVVPWWFNHCVHTNITVMILVETLLQARRHPTNKKLELSLVGGIGVLYAIVYYSIYFITGRWLYAVFGVMTWWQVCLYQLVIWGSTFVFYYLQFPINRIFHREQEKEVQKVEANGEKSRAFETTDEWNLKFKSLKGQFENSHL